MMSRVIGLVDILERWTAAQARLLLAIGTMMSLVEGYYYVSNALVFRRQDVLSELAKREDIHNLYVASAAAHWRDVPSWFAGPWNYPGVSYYRPMTSVLYFLEYRAFGDNFTEYNRISAVLHSINAASLFLLVCSLYRGWPRMRLGLGAIAVYYFATPASSDWFALSRCINWWPAQNDILSLTFGLPALLFFDQWLVHGKRWNLAFSIGFMIASICSKEMGYMIGPIMALLALYRKRLFSVGVALAIASTAGMWIFRRIVLFHPWEPNLLASGIPNKALMAWFTPFYWPMATGTYWHAIAAVLVLAIIGLASLRRVRFAVPIVLVLLIVPLTAQLVGPEPSFAKILVPVEMSQFTGMVVFLGAICLFVRFARLQPGIFASITFLLVTIPILQYFGGKHYHYWPSAFLSLADATFAGCLLQWGMSAMGRNGKSVGETITNRFKHPKFGLHPQQDLTSSVHER